MSRHTQPAMAVLSAVGATGEGKSFFGADAKSIKMTVNTSGSTTATIKVQVSNQDEAPDFSAAASVTNQWEYVQIRAELNAAALDGGTGIALTGTDINKSYEINTNYARWVTANVTAYTQGTITVNFAAASDS